MKPVLELQKREGSQFFTDYDQSGKLVKRKYWEVSWRKVGEARDIEHAKEQGFKNPVLGETEDNDYPYWLGHRINPYAIR